MESVSHLISIGYVCNVHALLLKMDKKSVAYPFDHLAIPMWAVNEVMANDFSDFLADSNLEKQLVFQDPDEELVVDNKYYVRFGTSKVDIVKKLKERISIRTQRLRDLLASTNEKVVFIRSEELLSYENRGTRVGHESYGAKYSKSEKQLLEDFVNHIKGKYPQLNFKVLYLTHSDESYHTNHVVGVHTDEKLDYRDRRIGNKMHKVLEDNKEFIEEHL